VPRRPRSSAPPAKSTPSQLNRDIANALIEQKKPQLAALFADPQARKTFAREMRHELQKQEVARVNAEARAAKPFTVKRLDLINDRQFRDLVGNYATLEEASGRADQVGGWVETREGRVVYGHTRAP
jgi:hypothetical protein